MRVDGRIFRGVAVVAALSGAGHGDAAEGPYTGQMLLEACEKKGDPSALAATAFSWAFCSGFVQGVADAGSGFCQPGGATRDQLKAVTVKWLKDHPESLDLKAAESTLRALAQAFPCATEKGGTR